MNKTHLAVILAEALLWIGAVAAALAGFYVVVVEDIEKSEIQAVALTVMVFVGFISVRMPFAILRGLLASYVIMPLMGFGSNERSPWRRGLTTYWLQMLRYVGWDYTLSETPSYERVATEIRDELRKIEKKMQPPRSTAGVEVVEIINRHVAFDVGEEWIRGRIVNLDHFYDEAFLTRLAADARSESVRLGAERRLTAIQKCGDDSEALREYDAAAYRN